MKINEAQKQFLLASANKVYKSYLGLDLFVNHNFSVNDSAPTSFFAVIKEMINTGTLAKEVTINGQKLSLVLIEVADSLNYTVSITRVDGSGTTDDTEYQVKDVQEYKKDQEALNLLLSQAQFSIEIDNSGKLYPANQVHGDTKIGGIGKYELYRTHLVTLKNIIDKISADEDISALLVAMATGSGKTWVQGLWMLVLYLAGQNSVFAIPANLVPQYKNDLKFILPDNVFGKISGFFSDAEDAQELNTHLSSDSEEPKIIVAASELLLDECYENLMLAKPEKTLLSFDEQHLLMKREKRRLMVIELSKKFLTMFLTATPNQETYELAGKKPVATMSSGQKEKAGQGKFPALHTLEAENISDRNRLNNLRFWTAEFWQNMHDGLLLRFINSIQDEPDSAAVSVVEKLPFFLEANRYSDDWNWGMQAPIARKMLCIIDENEELVNFCYTIQKNYLDDYGIYRNGNLVCRHDITDFFRFGNVEKKVLDADLQRKRASFIPVGLRSFQSKAAQDELVNCSFKQHLEWNIFHNMLEYVLTDLTGMSQIEHNKLRKENLEDFIKLVKPKLSAPAAVPRDNNYFKNKLSSLIDEEGASKIAPILAGIYTALQKNIERDLFRRYVRNYELDPVFGTLALLKEVPGLKSKFDAYAAGHLILGVMTGMQDSETSVRESQPFFGLKPDRYSMYDRDGCLVDKAKKRPRTSLETLNDQSFEYRFDPKYATFNEETADNYFKLGFVGVYVSNKKTQGFSDKNLHTVINISQSSESATNNPETLIQGIGRNRGLDETVEPIYIHALGREQKSFFSLENLKLDDYYPSLFKSQKIYNRKFIKILGKEVSRDIIRWYLDNLDEDETIDNDMLKKQVLKYIAGALRKLNDTNSHDIKLSRAQLSEVISVAMSSLDEEISKINKPYNISLSVRILGEVLNFVAEAYYSVRRIVPYFKILKHKLFAKSNQDNNPYDSVYIKIIQKTSYKEVTENSNLSREFLNWFQRRSKVIQAKLAKTPKKYLSEEKKEQLENQHKNKFILQFLAKFVTEPKQQEVMQVLQNLPDLLGFLRANKDAIDKIMQAGKAVTDQDILSLLQKLPGLESLTLTYIVNYPQQIYALQDYFKKGALHILKDNIDIKRGLVAYLQGTFLEDARIFFLDKDFVVLKEKLQNSEETLVFLDDFLKKLPNQEALINFNPNDIITAFNDFFGTDIASIATRIEDCGNSLQYSVANLQNDLLKNIKDETIDNIVQIIHADLLPCMVNTYPLDKRQEILEKANKDLIKGFLQKSSLADLEKLQVTDPSQAHEFFKSLGVEGLPEPLNLDAEQQRISKALEQSFTRIINAPAKALGSKFFNLSSWSGSLKNRLYAFDAEIVKEVIKSENFAKGISLLLSFKDWQDLKLKIKEGHGGSINLARAFIDNKDNIEEFTKPENLIKAINESYGTKYQFVGEKVESSIGKLNAIKQSIPEDLVAHLSPTTLAALAKIVREQLIPILATVITDEATRNQFISSERKDEDLVRFLLDNKDELAGLKELSSIDNQNVEEKFLGLINKLLSDDQKLTVGQLSYNLNLVAEKSELIKNNAQLACIHSFLSSEQFKEFACLAFNQEDDAALQKFLGADDNVNQLAAAINNSDLTALNEKSILELLQQQDPLRGIKLLDSRLQEFTEFSAEISSSFDAKKLSDLIVDEISEVIFHPEFYKSFHAMLGFLDESDFFHILKAISHNNYNSIGFIKDDKLKKDAELVTNFILMLKTGDKSLLKAKFLDVKEGTEFKPEDLNLTKVIELSTKIISEIINCHCYYNQHDKKGVCATDTDFALKDKLSVDLSEVKINFNHTFMDEFARRIFFFKAIKNSTSRCSDISADSNRAKVKDFTRIKKHILSPMWWSVGLSSISSKVVKSSHVVGAHLKTFAYGVCNFVKEITNVFKTEKMKISVPNETSKDYEDTAFDIADGINKLAPLLSLNLGKESPMDTICSIECEIEKRKPMRFFDSSSTVKVGNVAENVYPNGVANIGGQS